jgi:hypothetical protein
MTLDEFRATIAEQTPPESLSHALQTLWWDAKGDWNRAHHCAQQDDGRTGSSVHAYLHRKEGDMRNAAPTSSLESEWESLAHELLGDA